MCSNEFRGQVEGLEIERDRLHHTISHLERTNRELEAYLQSEGHDRDLRQAIGDNIVTIAKFKGQLERLEQEIRKARGEVVDVTLSQTSAVPVVDPPSQSPNTVDTVTQDTVEEDTELWM